jgi:hypothetical protein
MKFYFTILVVCLITNFSYSQAKLNGENKKLLVSINLGNLLVIRPQVSAEYMLNKYQSLELSIGYIAANSWLQKQTVLFTEEDHFMFSGISSSVGIKQYHQQYRKTYQIIQLNYHYSGYDKEKWNNGIIEGEEGSAAYLMSGKKHQLGLSFIVGTNKYLTDKLFFSIFGGPGLIYTNNKRTYHEELYNYEYYTRPLNENIIPFQIPINKIQPTVRLGIKLGFSY